VEGFFMGERKVITPDCVSDVPAGSIFYGVSVNCEWPEFAKFEAVKATNKQIIAKDINSYSKYERTLRISTWNLFYDYAEARDFWVEHHIDKEIANHHTQVDRLNKKRESLMESADL